MDYFTTSRSSFSYYNGYLDAMRSLLPRSLSSWYGTIIAKGAKLISLPLPLLSFLALPFFGGTSTSISLFFFYLTWTAIVFSRSPLEIEVIGTLIVRLVFYLLPAIAFLLLDWTFPSTARSIKTFGASASPHRLGRNKLFHIIAVASFNVGLSVLLQAMLEVFFTKVLLTRSLIKVSSILPLPLSIIQDFLRGFVVRGFLHFWSHRYLLHGQRQPFKQWHAAWQHSVRLPFSLIAAYDHPACFIVGQWLPTMIPAYLFRFHVLTLQLYLVLVSLEQLFIYSGYSILPSRIILGGMARRIDAHFLTVKQGGKARNFGHWGVLDLMYGTTCQDTQDFMDDLQAEADEHRVKQRASAAMKGAVSGVEEEERRHGHRKKITKNSVTTGDAAEIEISEEKTGEQPSGLRRKLTRRRKDQDGTRDISTFAESTRIP